MNRNYKRQAQSINKRMEFRYQIDKTMMTKNKFESFYYNDIEEGKLRSITPEMLEDFDNDPAYGNKTKTDEDFLDAAFDLLYNRYPNYDSEKIVHISSMKIYAAVDSKQDYKSINKICNTGDFGMGNIFVGAFFTDDKYIIKPIVNGCCKKDIEKHIRTLVCLTQSFKNDIAAIYEFEIDNIGVYSKKSLIGAQFDFKAKIYYPASLLVQYEINKNAADRNAHIFLNKRYKI